MTKLTISILALLALTLTGCGGVECASCANYAARVWMQRIFGKELFNKE